MVVEGTDIVSEIDSKDLTKALSSILESSWESAKWPVVVSVPKEIYFKLEEDSDIDNEQGFWKEIFNPNNFVTPKSENIYNPREHILFVLHSFKDREGKETVFKAITTSPKSLIEDPSNIISYRYHGQPCESRSKQIYPTCNFWKFYDNLSREDQSVFGIPSRESRKRFTKSKFFDY